MEEFSRVKKEGFRVEERSRSLFTSIICTGANKVGLRLHSEESAAISTSLYILAFLLYSRTMYLMRRQGGLEAGGDLPVSYKIQITNYKDF